MFRAHSNSNTGLRGAVPARRPRSVKVCDENAAPNRSVARPPMSHQLAGSNCKTSSVRASARRQRGITATQPRSQPHIFHRDTSSLRCQVQVLECGNNARAKDSTSSQAFRDITNTAVQSCASSDKEKKSVEVAPEFFKVSHDSIEMLLVSECQEAKRRRQLPVSSSDGSVRRRLPSEVIATILEMAGLKLERPEFEYADANLESDLQREYQIMPCRGFMSLHQGLNNRCHSVLIGWIVQVLDMCRLSRRTFFLTVSIIDRCLSCMQVDRMNLQLVGATAFLIAAKVEEIHPPDIAYLVYLCDGAYTTEQMLEMECTILQKLDFCVDGPTVEHFLPHFIAASQCGRNLGPDSILSNGLASLWHFSAASEFDQCRNGVAWYLSELALLEPDMMSQYRPSHLSASALYLANHLIKRPSPRGAHTEDAKVWDETMAQVSGYTEPMLVGCAVDLDRLRTAALSDAHQQIDRRHMDAVNSIRHAIFQPSHNHSGSPPYAVVASAVPYPC